MIQIVFPGPEHEKAIEIMERARKELEALGYTAGFTMKLNYEETVPSKSKECAFFQFNFVASIVC